MLTITKHRFRMDQYAVLNFSNFSLLGANIVLGFVTMDAINLVVAASGAAVTILANLDRVAYSLVRIRELAANGWRIPKDTDAGAPDTSDNNETPPSET